jgi:NadR type nicotinamide-nucleotide adenylyltransferase
MEKKNKLKKIAIVGPESTGKSALAKALAEYFDEPFADEFARKYLEEKKEKYTYDDLLIIAKGQIELEKKAESNAREFVFYDTNLLVIKIWSEFVFDRCDTFIQNAWNQSQFDVHLLCDIDLPWEEDPLREHPFRRTELFAIYERNLINSGRPYKIIRGQGKERIQKAIDFIEKKF